MLFWLAAAGCDDGGPELVPPQAAFVPTEPGVVGDAVTTEVLAADDQGVIGVRLFFDNLLVAEQQFAPYVLSWSAAGFADGEHTLKAMVTDVDGLEATAERTIRVDHTSPNIACPDIRKTGSPALLQCNVGDAHGVAGLEVELGDVRYRCDASASIELSGCGQERITVTAIDLVGNRNSKNVLVTIQETQGGPTICPNGERPFTLSGATCTQVQP